MDSSPPQDSDGFTKAVEGHTPPAEMSPAAQSVSSQAGLKQLRLLYRPCTVEKLFRDFHISQESAKYFDFIVTFDPSLVWHCLRLLVMSILRYFKKTNGPTHPLLPEPRSGAEESANTAVLASMEAQGRKQRGSYNYYDARSLGKNQPLHC